MPGHTRYMDKCYKFPSHRGPKATVRTSRGKNDGNYFKKRACDARTPHVASEYSSSPSSSSSSSDSESKSSDTAHGDENTTAV